MGSLYIFLEIAGILPAMLLLYYLAKRKGFLEGQWSFGYCLFLVYLSGVLTVVGFPDWMSFTWDFSVNWIPFGDRISDFRNACLNVLLFLPLGFLLPVLWEDFRSWKRTAWTGLLISGIIEGSQLFTFRTTDVNDLITNTLGTGIGFWFWRQGMARFPKLRRAKLPAGDFWVLLGIAGAAMFFLQPLASSAVWDVYTNVSNYFRMLLHSKILA